MSPSSPSCRVLLVDDHPETLDPLRQQLERAGHQVEAYAGVLYSIWAVNVSHKVYDLVISAIELSDGDGIELLTHLRQRMGVRTIALAGRGPESTPHRRVAAACPAIDAVLPHPAAARPGERLTEAVCDAACALLAPPAVTHPIPLPTPGVLRPPTPARLQA